MIWCNTSITDSRGCPNMAQVILSSADLLVWPVLVVGNGYVIGFLTAKLMRVPKSFRSAAAGSVAFGNSSGMPIALLSTLAPALVSHGVIQGDPLLFLSVYLVVNPLLQWTVGSALFNGDVDSGSELMSLTHGDSSCEEIQHSKWRIEKPSKWIEGLSVVFSSPPVVATLLGNLVALIRPLQNQFVNLHDWSLPSTRVLDWLFNGIRDLGAACVPVALLVLGSNLSKGADFKSIPMTTAVAPELTRKASSDSSQLFLLGFASNREVLSLAKMLVQPAVVACWVSLASHLEGPGHQAARGKWLVAMIVSLTPTANNVMVQVEVGAQDKAAMGGSALGG